MHAFLCAHDCVFVFVLFFVHMMLEICEVSDVTIRSHTNIFFSVLV